MRKLTQKDANAIRRAHDEHGQPPKALATKYRVAENTIRNILNGDTFNPGGEYVPPRRLTLSKALAQVMGEYRKKTCREIAEAIHKRHGRRYAVQSIRNQICKYFEERK